MKKNMNLTGLMETLGFYSASDFDAEEAMDDLHYLWSRGQVSQIAVNYAIWRMQYPNAGWSGVE